MDDASLTLDLPPDSFAAAFPTDDEDLFDFVNLSAEMTGVEGVIFISTRSSQHGPRVKWTPGPLRGDRPSCSFSLEEPPRLVASLLPPRLVRGIEPQLTAWIAQNRQALLSFWNEGAYWMADEVEAFRNALKPVET